MTVAAWVAVGGSAGLAPGAVMPAIVRGTELAVWRDAAGAVHAWRDRCPHRGMRLSMGFVDGDGRLACRYHGWRFGAGGTCATIPAHPGRPAPDDISAQVFASQERDGLIWVALADTAPLGEIASPGEELVFCRSLVVRAGIEAVIDAAEALVLAPGIARTERAGAPLVLALQPVDAARTGIHLMAVANGADVAVQRLDAAAWGRRLRGRVEARSNTHG
jgi:nitrite reductase/ring-hydroxylating ferredoxin subunit